jgi:hypothetical protein
MSRSAERNVSGTNIQEPLHSAPNGAGDSFEVTFYKHHVLG